MSKVYTIAGKNGVPMLADLHEPTRDTYPLVLYAHGINGFKDWGGMNLIAEAFANAGLGFLKFNFSHNGTTPARPEEFFDLEVYSQDNYLTRQTDLDRMIDFVKEYEIPATEIYLLGHSRGGADVLLAAKRHPEIKKVCTWASVSHCRTPWNHFKDEDLALWRERGYFTRKNGRTGQDMPIAYQLYEEYLAHKEELDLEAVVRGLKQELMFIHGEDDEAVFVKEAYDLKSWQPEAQVKIIPGADHVFNRKHPWTHPELPAESLQAVEATLSFFKNV